MMLKMLSTYLQCHAHIVRSGAPRWQADMPYVGPTLPSGWPATGMAQHTGCWTGTVPLVPLLWAAVKLRHGGHVLGGDHPRPHHAAAQRGDGGDVLLALVALVQLGGGVVDSIIRRGAVRLRAVVMGV
jgi:hypothetical protein